ncbi:MAG: SDR family NAD(P)-dependent oxidoreductase, partial [Nocardioides sp.]
MGELGYDYSGCRILVVGGTRGAGWSTAQAFREFGADVVVTGTHYLTTFYEADLAGLTYRQLDLTDPDQIQDFADRLGPIDVLVNAAGSRLPYGAAGPEQEFIVQAARLGLAGPLFLANKLRGRLASSPAGGGGAVINLPGTRAWWELGQEVTDL